MGCSSSSAAAAEVVVVSPATRSADDGGRLAKDDSFAAAVASAYLAAAQSEEAAFLKAQAKEANRGLVRRKRAGPKDFHSASCTPARLRKDVDLALLAAHPLPCTMESTLKHLRRLDEFLDEIQRCPNLLENHVMQARVNFAMRVELLP
mmetsp:Transcript_31396/g.73273  ORF Transcript_31396/g.73273 Transcript_31396/m.73273 type:complete len:149 (+) Transcript_31396:96-542(+)|eukprot:CAMPEP_0178436506 /NCGR_PEP_ID=MMETSP0689_2-20121128/34474_1 /TAXON_ID=160604 /ORGANISM="Amphidinium massartii, Strain CS-259" /LENGTH=148 /DNA_ID=CAMNT_0020058603 /DNA_START=50 /DNA_END=496 /DNA_ORIENTATION=-